MPCEAGKLLCSSSYTEREATMRGLFLVTLCLIVTLLCWGIYGPTLDAGRLAMVSQPSPS